MKKFFSIIPIILICLAVGCTEPYDDTEIRNDIKDLQGFSGLDAETTIVCIRNVDVTSTFFRKNESQKMFENSEDMLRALLAYESKK